MLKKRLQHPILLGCSVFALQLLIILSICPEKSWVDSWLSLASHWDSEWYKAIAQYGYINIDGPIHCGLRNANVVFFPGYPYLARLLVVGLHVDATVALLIVSQSAALGFWCCLFYLLRHLSLLQQCYAALLILAFPTSWFLDMAYAESLFILACCLMLWWATEKRWLGSAVSGVLMTATRLIGLPVVAAPFLAGFILNFSQFKLAVQNTNGAWVGQVVIRPYVMLALGSMGCLSFFIYCAHYFGSWHLYFDMERAHWSGTADPLFLFKLPTWVPPPWGYGMDMAPFLPNNWSKLLRFDFFRVAAYTFSEILVPLFMWLNVFFLYRFFKKSRLIDEKSLTWFLAGLLVLLFSCFSLATRHYESMSRCLLPVWILLVVSDALNQQGSFFFRRLQPIYCRMAIGCVLVISLGFWIELLNRFFLGWWVA